MTELDLRETLERHLDAVDVPPAPLGPVVAKGRRRHRRRRAAIGTSVAVTLSAVAASGVVLMTSDDEGRGVDTSHYASLGALDFANGARAYADPGRELHLAGRTFPAEDLDYLDTDAVATRYGMVFFDGGRPMLLGDAGRVTALFDGPLDDPNGFHPTAKADAGEPYVAFATIHAGTATLTVHNLATGLDRASTRSTATLRAATWSSTRSTVARSTSGLTPELARGTTRTTSGRTSRVPRPGSPTSGATWFSTAGRPGSLPGGLHRASDLAAP